MRSHCRLFYTLRAVCLRIFYPSKIPQQSVRQLPCSIDRLEKYGQASLFGCSYYYLMIASSLHRELRATIASRHTAMCTDAHRSRRHVEFRSILVYFSAASTRTMRLYQKRPNNKELPMMAMIYLQYITPGYCQYWKYPPKLLRVSAAPAVSNPEILLSSGSINVQSLKYRKYNHSWGSIEQ